MYRLLLLTHGWLGWVVFALVTVALAWPPRPDTAPTVRRAIWLALVILSLGGVLLYARYSPFTAGVRANIEVVVTDPTLRYWIFVHPLAGLLAVALIARSGSTSGHPARSSQLNRWSALVVLAVLLIALVWRG